MKRITQPVARCLLTVSCCLTTLVFAQGAPSSSCQARISANDTLRFTPSVIEVPHTCERYVVIFRHDGLLPKRASPRNWVLTRADQVQAVVREAEIAGEKGQWLKADDDRIIAHSAVLGRDESQRIEFSTERLDPQAEYVFLSTIPGVSPVLRGKLVVIDRPIETNASQK